MYFEKKENKEISKDKNKERKNIALKPLRIHVLRAQQKKKSALNSDKIFVIQKVIKNNTAKTEQIPHYENHCLNSSNQADNIKLINNQSLLSRLFQIKQENPELCLYKITI